MQAAASADSIEQYNPLALNINGTTKVFDGFRLEYYGSVGGWWLNYMGRILYPLRDATPGEILGVVASQSSRTSISRHTDRRNPF